MRHTQTYTGSQRGYGPSNSNVCEYPLYAQYCCAPYAARENKNKQTQSQQRTRHTTQTLTISHSHAHSQVTYAKCRTDAPDTSTEDKNERRGRKEIGCTEQITSSGCITSQKMSETRHSGRTLNIISSCTQPCANKNKKNTNTHRERV